VSTARPSFFDPCLPVLGRIPPKGPDWVHQAKLDGYRFLIGKIGQRVRLYAKSGAEWSDRLPGLVAAFAELRTDFILDGELCLCDDRGRPDFRALHAEMRQRRPDTSQIKNSGTTAELAASCAGAGDYDLSRLAGFAEIAQR